MSKRSPSERAFSLVELLAVISIVAMFSVLVTPAFSSLVGASGPTRAITEASGLLEQARQSAIQLGTWVWVGVADTSTLSDGEQQLTLVSVASRDGSDDLSAANLMQLTRAARIARAKTTSAPEAGALSLGAGNGGFSFKWRVPTSAGAQDVDFSGTVIGFSPRGEAIVGPRQTPEWIKLSFASATNPKDVMALLVDGPSGQVVVAR